MHGRSQPRCAACARQSWAACMSGRAPRQGQVRCGLRLHGAATGAKSALRPGPRAARQGDTARAALAALPVRGARQGGWVRP